MLCQGIYINILADILGLVFIIYQWTPLRWRLGCTSVLQVLEPVL
jgi:hypothetical protein